MKPNGDEVVESSVYATFLAATHCVSCLSHWPTLNSPPALALVKAINVRAQSEGHELRVRTASAHTLCWISHERWRAEPMFRKSLEPATTKPRPPAVTAGGGEPPTWSPVGKWSGHAKFRTYGCR